MARNKPAAAIRVLQTALMTSPDQPDLLFHLGAAHLRAGDGTSACRYLEPLSRAFPNEIPVQEAYGASLSMQGRHTEAISVFEAIAVKARTPEQAARLKYHTVLALQELSRAEEALDILGEIRKTAPDNAEYQLAEAKLHSDLGNVTETEKRLKEILDRDPGDVDAFVLLHKITLRDPNPNAIAKIDALLDEADPVSRDAINLNFLAGEILDRQTDIDSAFQRFDTANRVRRKLDGQFDFDAHSKLIDRTRKVFDRAFMERYASEGVSADSPIFIIGMPRSGTSLVEQILASHDMVQGAGEREDMGIASGKMAVLLDTGTPYPDCLNELTPDAARALAGEYLRNVSAGAAAGQRVTDKMPRNFLLVGLIRVLFPGAPVVHCVRDPMDTCLSCFITNFGRRQLFSTDLRDLANYYASYEKMMLHWEDVSDPPVYRVTYEDLVANPEIEIHKLVEYCNLPWDEKCLSPHLAERAVQTASRWQVRNPIYRSSVSKSQKYGAHLGELRSALAIAD
ncbi:MAG: tetratricopeptide repeat-containing sulfotransferase family protein [Alphaproteobacteria bacterium]